MTAVRWGILTGARIARRRFIPSLHSAANAEAVAISTSSSSPSELAAETGIPRGHASHWDLLADPQIDAVYLPFPNKLHCEWIVAAAQAGKHILCEKPLVCDPVEYARAIEVCALNEALLMEAFMYRFHPQHQLLRETLNSGRLGELVSIHARFHFPMERSVGEYRLSPGPGAGALDDVGCYAVDAMNSIVGRLPVKVYCQGKGAVDKVDTTAAAVLDYGSVLGTFDCGFEGPRTNELLVIGTEGQIFMQNAFDPLPGEPIRVTITDRGGAVEVIEAIADPFKLEIEHFSSLVRAGITKSPHHDSAAQNLAVRMALHQSMELSMPREVHPLDVLT